MKSYGVAVRIVLALLGTVIVLMVGGCGDGNQSSKSSEAMSPSATPPPTWGSLRTKYQPLLTKGGISKGCNYQVDAASCFAGLDAAARNLYAEIGPMSDSPSKRDVQGQISKFAADYSNYVTKCGPPIGSCTKFEAMIIDVSALGIWRAMVQATD